MEYDPNFPTYKHSDKFESRAMVKMMQKEATLAERAWEERTSQRDNNKVYFNHLTRDEADIEMKMRMEKYKLEDSAHTFSGKSLYLKLSILQTVHSYWRKNRDRTATKLPCRYGRYKSGHERTSKGRKIENENGKNDRKSRYVIQF